MIQVAHLRSAALAGTVLLAGALADGAAAQSNDELLRENAALKNQVLDLQNEIETKAEMALKPEKKLRVSRGSNPYINQNGDIEKTTSSSDKSVSHIERQSWRHGDT